MHRRIARLLVPAVALVIAFAPDALARAGGGRNGGGSGILYLILLPFFIAYALYVNHRINKKRKQTEAAIGRMAAKDSAWEKEKLEVMVREDFFVIEQAWCDRNYALLQGRLGPELFGEWHAQLEAMRKQGHSNVMEGLSLQSVRFVDAKDYPGADRDEFEVCIDASAVDYTIDEKTGGIVDSNTGSRRAAANKEKKRESFREFWTYRRQGSIWRLRRIGQSSAWKEAVQADIVEQG
jgi:hypothetical protein